ncbi:hypothetical protein AAG906_038872 [Vitis piasezkii]
MFLLSLALVWLIARHVVEVPFTEFGSLVLALYDVEDGISRGLWFDYSPVDAKKKKPIRRQRPNDLIDQGLVHLGQLSVTNNPLPAHTSHAVSSPTGGIHFMDFTQPDDGIHLLSWDNYDPKPIEVDESYKVDGVILKPQASAPFTLVPDTPLV